MNDSDFKNLDPTVKKLGVVSFFADVASEMLYPITPIFLTTILGASMSSLGIIEGTAEAIASLLKTYSGVWSDRLSKRKPFIILGYLLGGISKPFIGISTSWFQVLFLRVLDRTGKGLRSSPRDALIADVVSPSQRGSAFGWHRSMDTLGAAVGPLLTITLLSLTTLQLRSLYFFALIPGLLSVAMAMTIKEQKHPLPRVANTKTNWSLKQLTPSLKTYLIAWTIFSLTNSSDVFILMKAKNSGFSTNMIVFLYCAYNLIYALSSPYLGSLSDKLPRKYLMFFGLLTYSFVYLGFGLSSEPWHYWILFIFYGLYMGATDGVGKALAVDLSPEHQKATTLGLLGTSTGFATIIASSLAGIIWDSIGSSYTFFFGTLGALLASALILTLKTSEPDQKFT